MKGLSSVDDITHMTKTTSTGSNQSVEYLLQSFNASQIKSLVQDNIQCVQQRNEARVVVEGQEYDHSWRTNQNCLSFLIHLIFCITGD